MKAFYRNKLLCDLKDLNTDKSSENTKQRYIRYHADNQLCILIVDDEPTTLELLSIIVSKENYHPLTANSVTRAIAHLQSCSEIALIICDLRMPGQDGFELLKFLQSNLRFRHIPVIICSSCANVDFVTHARSLGASDYISKPYTPEMIITRVRNALKAIRRRILLVTEDDLIPKLFRRALESTRYDMLLANSGERALQLLEKEKIDIIISELALTDMTGFDLLTQLYKINFAIPMLFLDDPQLKIHETEITTAGGYGLIRRPFNNLEINQKLSETITSFYGK
ncbi:MAG: response regulator [candidate division Zixibacteria bacterium]|nr:response regulator [candidate division Zixibacteria bacterium]